MNSLSVRLHTRERRVKMSNLVEQLISWANINSGSENLQGLAAMSVALRTAFHSLGAPIEQVRLPPRKKVDSKGHIIELPNADALHISKHPKAGVKVLFAGHMDTVFDANSPFQKAERHGDRLIGPGVADMKGGLLVMLKVLEQLEQSPLAGKIGWEVIINPDEEIGSSGSAHLFEEAAKRNQVGLLFEPTFDDGSLVSARKGSANYTIVAYGRSAHAGRDFSQGRNAISALARLIIEADQLTDLKKGLTVNFGQIEGGTAANIVPDLALAKLNVRAAEVKDLIGFKEKLQLIAHDHQHDGVHFVIHELISRAPKPFDAKHQQLYAKLQAAAKELNLNLTWKPSGGVCDGNILAAAGLPTIDTLGVIGGQLHTHDEFMLINSLEEKIGLVTRFLENLYAS